ncbi:RNA polymerase sigma factor [Caldalkalibacillus salinus]|uniref:RNA polymerase sigma factor n=1 Tax=Caldalkalibacillus salinus TaxID=2803787 RepID=UPI001F2B9B25|nr:RNA polymerase sigma factor [Caldalkalibacillus salinus]
MEDLIRKDKLQDWYHAYHQEIYRYILLLLGDHEQAKDLTQDTFIKAYESMDAFQGVTSDKNWLYRIARNVAIDFMRKRKPIRYMLESFATWPSDERCPQQIAALGETERELYRALRKLKRSYQEVVILRKNKELSIQETAEVLQWSESKVKNTLFRGLSALKREMVKEGYEHETWY